MAVHDGSRGADMNQAAAINDEALGAPGQRVTALGAMLRTLRRGRGEDLASMARGFDGLLPGLTSERLSAIERGDAAPPVGLARAAAARLHASAETRAALERAEFLAADPIRSARSLTASAHTGAELLRALAAPLARDLEDDEAEGRAAFQAAPAALTPTAGRLKAPRSLPDRALRAAKATRATLADGDGRVCSRALCDGFELLFSPTVRLVFAGPALSARLFEAVSDETMARSGPFAPSGGEIWGGGVEGGGYVCLRHGALARLSRHDPAARFGLLREFGLRLLGAPPSQFDLRVAKDPKRIATHRRPEAAGAQGPTAALRLEAAANLFAFAVLAPPESFAAAFERLDRWAARLQVPFPVALRFHRDAPALFAPRTPSPHAALPRLAWPGARRAAPRRRPAV